MKNLQREKREWDELAEMDPLWAILSDPKCQHGKWDVAEFLATGQKEVSDLMRTVREMGYPQSDLAALDFGCGVGRLTRALAKHFRSCVGVDLSSRMIEQARELNRDVPNCEFVANACDNLGTFPAESFDLIFSMLALQHVPRQRVITTYIAEFVRTLKPGGILVFQLPSYISLRHRIRVRSRLYSVLRAFGLSHWFLYKRWHMQPMRMQFVPEEQVVQCVKAAQGVVLRTAVDVSVAPALLSCTYYVTK